MPRTHFLYTHFAFLPSYFLSSLLSSFQLYFVRERVESCFGRSSAVGLLRPGLQSDVKGYFISGHQQLDCWGHAKFRELRGSSPARTLSVLDVVDPNGRSRCVQGNFPPSEPQIRETSHPKRTTREGSAGGGSRENGLRGFDFRTLGCQERRYGEGVPSETLQRMARHHPKRSGSLDARSMGGRIRIQERGRTTHNTERALGRWQIQPWNRCQGWPCS